MTFHGFLPEGCCFLHPEKWQEGARATVKMPSYKCLSHQREVGLVVLAFSFGKCFESELTSMKTGC